jgi:SAM-dependent methyltransferase
MSILLIPYQSISSILRTNRQATLKKMQFHPLFRRVNLNLRYFGKPPWDTNQSPVELLEFIQTHPSGKALDLGCGTGTNCLTLALAGWQTTGVDLAWRAIVKARRRFDENDLVGDFHSADILHSKEPESSFDLVLDVGCYHSLPAESRPIYQANIFRWLKPGGSHLIYGHKLSKGRPDPTSLTEQDIHQFEEKLKLVNRKDCEDHWGRKTIWLWFMKPEI